MNEARACPVCDTPSLLAIPFLNENIDPARLTAMTYASRKAPEYMSYRLVQCPACDLVYAPEPPPPEQLEAAYHQADYDSAGEAEDAARAYIRAMRPILAKLARRERALEIGAGTGILLELLGNVGFVDLVGVEPSPAAIAAAPSHRRQWLQQGLFDDAAFDPESFDLVCCFMTMEHVHDPMATAAGAFRLLRPGGAFVTVTHDYRSLVNRLLGKKSPIIDIEHLQLFSARSILELFQRSGFAGVSAMPLTNRYALGYWVRLAPLPLVVKNLLATLLRRTRLDRLKPALNVGNVIAAGFKPD